MERNECNHIIWWGNLRQHNYSPETLSNSRKWFNLIWFCGDTNESAEVFSPSWRMFLQFPLEFIPFVSRNAKKTVVNYKSTVYHGDNVIFNTHSLSGGGKH